MREDFMSRKEKHEEAIENFLKDSSQNTLELILYSTEIKYLKRHYPEIVISKDSVFKENLFNCTVSKR